MIIGGTVGYLVQKYYAKEATFGNLIILLVAFTHSTTIHASLTESLNHLFVDLTERSHFKADLSPTQRYLSTGIPELSSRFESK